MNIAVLGAGFSGLAASHNLSQNKNLNITVFESLDSPGGLAIGFNPTNWQWPLEQHYHHLFTSDHFILNLAKEVNHNILFSRPKTSMLTNGSIHQLDSPINLLMFDKLNFPDRIRTGITLAYLKLTPNWQTLETVTAESFIKKTMGNTSWKILWQPLFEGKFGNLSESIPASWFWARIKKRSATLAYPSEGFLSLAKSIEASSKRRGVNFLYKTPVKSIKKSSNKFVINNNKYDSVIYTLPLPLLPKLTDILPTSYTHAAHKIKTVGATNMVLRLKKPFLKDGTYWLNINQKDFPFLALVEHTNFISPAHYSNEYLVYVGNYLPPNAPLYNKSPKSLFTLYQKSLDTLSPNFHKNLIGYHLFKTPFAQPIFPLNYSKIIPSIKTPAKGFYCATMQQVYPWDRGTNYAVEIGQKAAKLLLNNL